MDYGDSYDPWKYVWMFSRQYGNPLVIDGRAPSIDAGGQKRAFDSYFGFRTQDGIANQAGSVGIRPVDAGFRRGQGGDVDDGRREVQPTLMSSSVADD